MTDLDLLAQYTRHQSRKALEELIRRHAPWVHAIATRRVGDEHLAQDVMQAVFLVLAQKPPRITSASGLPGWLFGVTCNASNQALRSETRLKRRERAFAMEHSEANQDQEVSQQQWEAMAPHLDVAVQALGEEDRSAVLLRFYQQKSHADVAAALGVSEEAARKRVSRAVAKLRDVLQRRGMAVPAMAPLALMLESHVVPPVSAAVVQSALAVVSGAAASQAVAIAKGAVVMAAWSKAQVAAVACVALLLVGSGAGIAVHIARGKPPQPAVQAQPAPAAGEVRVTPAPPRPPAPAAPDPNWRARFDQVYFLAEGEVLKRIPPPFIPERLDWYRTNDRTQSDAIPRGADYMTFQWDGKLKNWGMGFGYRDGQTVREILRSTLRMKTYEYDGPADLLSHRLKGDFIFKSNASQQELLDALCQIVRADGGPATRFVQQTLNRPVIVATGRYELRPLQDATDPKSVHLYVGEPDKGSGGGGGSGDVSDLIMEVGSRAGLFVVNEVVVDAPTQVSYRYHRTSNIAQESPGPKRDEKVRMLLDAVGAQTGLQFRIEMREAPVWMALPGDAKDGL